MIFHEGEIEFDRLDWKQFEELCYDILVKFNFHTMSRRHGGIGNDRDIEARRYIITETSLLVKIQKSQLPILLSNL